MKYKGSIDMMMELQSRDFTCDAVWPANSIWIAIGDKHRRVKHVKSIMTSPVVFGIRKSLAEKLGFVGKPVHVKDILSTIRDKKLTFMMTSATQSNSGASAYIGFLYAMMGNPDMLTREQLFSPKLKVEMRALLSGINRSSGSSGWLKELFLKGNYDSMVNYESMIIETNRELVKSGREPLYAVYPVDGIVMSDSPLGFVNQGDPRKEEFFKKLQDYLLSEKSQKIILEQGRRTGMGGILGEVDKDLFNPAWGIDISKILSPVRMPPPEVILEALSLYQKVFRKPSLTVYCLDFSGSMSGTGNEQLKGAMELILDQKLSSKYLIDVSDEDVTIVIPFSDSPMALWKVKGNDAAQLSALLQNIRRLAPKGGTDIYSPVMTALESIQKEHPDNYLCSVVLMTDGISNVGRNIDHVRAYWEKMGLDIPVFSIMFGNASENQLKNLSEMTRGRVFDGRKDLLDAFRKVKGYN
jgi:Ca-activated chloride channel family protein